MKWPTLTCICLGTAVAAQPFSHSMAECAAQVSASNEWTNDAVTTAQLQVMQDRWMSAAFVQAQSEGVAEPRAAMAAVFKVKKEDWLKRGRFAVFLQDYKDWTAYCRSFAHAQGINLIAN